MTCSFQKEEAAGMEHWASIPKDIKQPEELPNDKELINKLAKDGKLSTDDRNQLIKQIEEDVIEWRRMPTDREEEMPNPYERRVRAWVRARGNIKTPGFVAHAMAMAYYSDAWFIGTALKVYNKGRTNIKMMMSLDHSIFFHQR